MGAGAIERLTAGGNPPAPAGDDELWKWSIRASYYVRSGDRLLCTKCPNACSLADGDTGRCRNRVNHRGEMYSIVYGNPCAVHIDPVEKKPLFHFLPSTTAFSIAAAGCNIACLNCQNWQISQASPYETANTDLMPVNVVDQCIAGGCASIAYTYSEPTTFYEYAFDTAGIAGKRGVRNIWKSNGYINEAPLRALCRRIDAANIDLKGFDDGVYQKLNRASLAPVLRTLKILREENVWLEITNLVIPGWTDNSGDIRKMCDWLVAGGFSETPLHFSRFIPLYKLTQLPSTPVETLEQACRIAAEAGMKYVYLGNVPGHDAENTRCPKCRTVVVGRKGFRVTERHLDNGRCASCRTRIAGIWS